MKQKYFFRDRYNKGNTIDNKSYHAAGYVEKVQCDINCVEGNASGKDFAVVFINPFTGYIERRWRMYSDIIIMKADEVDYKLLKERFEMIEKTIY